MLGLMSTLSSSSTLQQVLDAYVNSASYEEDNDLAKARAFITACRILSEQRPVEHAHGGRGAESIRFDPEQLPGEIKAARQFIAARVGVNNGGAGVKHYDLSGFRN